MSPIVTDSRVVLTVVLVLGAVTLVGLGLVGLLAYQGKAIPDAMIALASGASGALAALLAKTSTETPPPPPPPSLLGDG